MRSITASTQLMNSSQTLAASYRYDPFGNTISSAGSLAEVNLYRFSSKKIDPYTGYYYYGYRWYASHLQRWLNRDPLGETGLEALGARKTQKGEKAEIIESANLYTFIANAPIGFIDGDGRKKLPPLPPVSDPRFEDLCQDRCLAICQAAPCPDLCAQCCFGDCADGKRPSARCWLAGRKDGPKVGKR